MNETSQAIAAVKREEQLSEWQRQIQERQEQGRTVDEWCISLGISKGTYYHRLRKVREYMCQRMGVTEELDVSLTERQKEILEKFEENMNEMHGITERDAFSYGFRLGVQLMAKAFLQPICDED